MDQLFEVGAVHTCMRERSGLEEKRTTPNQEVLGSITTTVYIRAYAEQTVT